MVKVHVKKPFGPNYEVYYRIVSFKGNQVEIMPQEGEPSQMVHISDVKYILPADSIIQHLPNFNHLGRKTKYNINPEHIVDLSWQLTTTLNTNPVITLSFSVLNHKCMLPN